MPRPKKAATKQVDVPAVCAASTPDNVKKDIPIEALIEYRQKNLTYKEIATLVGCSEANVQKRLSKVDLEGLDLYSKHKAEVFEAKQRQLIESLTDDKIDNMSGSQVLVGVGILEDKVRTIRGQATQVIDHRVITASLEEITQRMISQGLVIDDKVIDVG